MITKLTSDHNLKSVIKRMIVVVRNVLQTYQYWKEKRLEITRVSSVQQNENEFQGDSFETISGCSYTVLGITEYIEYQFLKNAILSNS